MDERWKIKNGQKMDRWMNEGWKIHERWMD
jgi:hypothetical protein